MLAVCFFYLSITFLLFDSIGGSSGGRETHFRMQIVDGLLPAELYSYDSKRCLVESFYATFLSFSPGQSGGVKVKSSESSFVISVVKCGPVSGL